MLSVSNLKNRIFRFGYGYPKSYLFNKKQLKFNLFLDDDSIVDLSSAAAALLPEEQRILEKQIPENNKISPLNSPSKSPPPPPLPLQLLSQSSLSINEDKKFGEEQQLPIIQQQNLIYQYSLIKLTLDEEEALIFLLELMVRKEERNFCLWGK